jgi:hypothetical protein
LGIPQQALEQTAGRPDLWPLIFHELVGFTRPGRVGLPRDPITASLDFLKDPIGLSLALASLLTLEMREQPFVQEDEAGGHRGFS